MHQRWDGNSSSGGASVRPPLLCISAALAALVLTACSSKSVEPPGDKKSPERIVSTTPPFKTREPERYKAVRTITFTSPSGESTTTKTEIARSQSLRREEEVGEPVFLLETELGRFLVSSKEKLYADVSGEPLADSDSFELDNSPERLLHTGNWASTYEKLGSEMIAGRQTTKYKVSVNASAGVGVSNIETTIWLDEKIGMPVRSETSGADGSRTVMELSQLDMNVDQVVFQIPPDFQRVTAAELRRRVKSLAGGDSRPTSVN